MKQNVFLLLCFLACANVNAQFTLSGNIATENNVPVEGVNIPLAQNGLTDIFGNYSIDNLAAGTYVVSPEKNDDYLNGVTICDLVGISYHILGIESLDSPYKMIAADANSSNSISTLDLVKLHRLLLGIDEDFTPNQSWRFLDSEFVFDNPNNPTQGGSGGGEVEISGNTTKDFIAVKVGDVDNSALGSYPGVGALDLDILFFQHNNAVVEPQANYVVEFSAMNFNEVLGFQFTLSYDASQLEFVEINSTALANFNQIVNYYEIEPGSVVFIWTNHITDALTLADGEAVFTATFNVLQETNLETSLTFTGDHVPVVSMDEDGCYGELENVVLNYVENNTLTNVDVFPNPTSGIFIVDVELENSEDINIALNNVIGQSIFNKSYHNKNLIEQINLNNYPAGTYLLTIQAGDKRTTKRIVKL